MRKKKHDNEEKLVLLSVVRYVNECAMYSKDKLRTAKESSKSSISIVFAR